MENLPAPYLPVYEPHLPLAPLPTAMPGDGLFQRFFEHNGSVMLLIEPKTGVIVAANQAAAEFYGYARAQLTDMPISMLNTRAEDDIAQDRSRALNTENTYFSFQHKLASGELRDVDVYSAPLEMEGSTLLYSIVHDVSERNRAQRQLSQSELRYRTVFETSQEAISVYRVADGSYVDCNPAFLRISGYERQEVVGRKAIDLGLWVDLDARQRLFNELENSGHCRNLETQFRNKNGKLFWGVISSSYVEIEGHNCILSMMRDISEAKMAEEEIRSMAFYDPLTALPNRHLMLERLRKLLSSRSGKSHALLFIDLDNFKPLNDTYGHETGDLLLKEVARRLSSCVRKSDTVARYGGDEFVVLLEELSEVEQQAALDARLVGEKLLNLVGHPYVLRDKAWRCTASIGVALFGSQRIASSEVVQLADRAMYRSKAAGRNRLSFATPE